MSPHEDRGRLRGSLRLRLLAGTLAWILGTLAVAGWGLSGLFAQHLSRQFDAELLTHLDQLTAVLTFESDGSPVLSSPLSDPRTRRPYGGLYWQAERIDGSMPLRSRSLWDGVLKIPPDHPADGELHHHRLDGPDGRPVRVLERTIRPTERPGEAWRLLVAEDEARLRDAHFRFTRQLLIALGVLAAGLVAAAIVQVYSGLRPLARLRDALASVRRGEAQAIGGRFPSEIQPLVDEFNAVLARNAEVVDRARTQAGNLAHALKTPLTVLANATAHDDSALAAVVREQVTSARVQVDHHLARARAAAAAQVPGQRSALRPALEALLRVMARVHADRGIHLQLQACPADAFFRGAEQDLQEMLGNLLDNACKWAHSRVEVHVEKRGEKWRITITDDGPGLPEPALQAVLERGVRADEHTPGSGLGLAIVRELAQIYGGSIRLHSAPQGGLCAELSLPAA